MLSLSLSLSLSLTSISMMLQWNPTTLEEVKNEDIDRVFQPFSSERELQVPSDDSNRWAVIHLKSPTSLMDPIPR
jgi:hypothetical protein